MPFVPNTMVFTVDLPKFPEWAIPFTKVIPKIHFDNDYDVINDIYYTANCRHWWTELSDGWQLRVEINLDAYRNSDSERINCYLDVDLVIINENIWEELNPSKV